MGLWKAITTNHVATQPGHADPRLEGRTYAIPFAAVWDGAVRLAAGGLRGWQMVHWDDQVGTIEAKVKGMILSLPADVVIRIRLDENAQTRVDLEARGTGKGGDLGANARRTQRFFRALDREVNADHHTILVTAKQATAA